MGKLPKWHAHGGWNFAFPPQFGPTDHPAVWRVCETPSIIVFHAESDNPQTASIASMLDPYEVVVDTTNNAGRHLVLNGQCGRYRLLIKSQGFADFGYIVAPDASLRTRLAAIAAFHNSGRFLEVTKPRDVLVPSNYQKHRLTLMLGILDCIGNSDERRVTIREIAQEVVFPNSDLGRFIEWKSSSERRQTQRLLNEARYMRNGGYRLLLRGKTTISNIDR